MPRAKLPNTQGHYHNKVRNSGYPIYICEIGFSGASVTDQISVLFVIWSPNEGEGAAVKTLDPFTFVT